MARVCVPAIPHNSNHGSQLADTAGKCPLTRWACWNPWPPVGPFLLRHLPEFATRDVLLSDIPLFAVSQTSMSTSLRFTREKSSYPTRATARTRSTGRGPKPTRTIDQCCVYMPTRNVNWHRHSDDKHATTPASTAHSAPRSTRSLRSSIGQSRDKLGWVTIPADTYPP